MRLIVLNGGSSSGKSGIVRCLQAVLPDPWLAFGVDAFIEALPARMQASDEGIRFEDGGGISVGADFMTLETAWMAGVAATARHGARIIIDDVFLGGAGSQRRWRDALGDLPVLWVGVKCDPEVATARESARGDRVPGMAERQARIVHEGVAYDLEVDTTHTGSLECARVIAARVS